MTPRAFISRTAAFLFGIAGALLLLEGVLRLLPVIEGTYAAEPRASWPVHTMIPDSRYTYSKEWNLQNVHHGRINNFGYPAPFDYPADKTTAARGVGVAVFGDSYIEGLMNDYPDTLQGSLNDYLQSPQTVLHFGVAGAEMPDYLGLAPLVRDRFAPRWAVIVITAGDFTNGFRASPGFFEWQADRSPPIRLVPQIHRSARAKFLRTVALIRYVRGNLSIRPEALIQLRRGSESVGAGAPCKPEVLSSGDEALLAGFARELPPALGLPPSRIILVFDSDRRSLAAGAAAPRPARCPQRAVLANDRLREIAAQEGMHVVDSYPVFQRHVAAGLGPVDRSPSDAHWNAAAHRLMAREVARIIDNP